MISFLRRLRKNFLTSNKFTKYLIYAIGEIVLVVIGILLALQINNWNEERKADEFESEILIQIHENIQRDKLRLQEIKNNLSNAYSSTEKLINDTIREANKDSIKYWLGDVIQFDRFQPITNSYEILKSKGLENISNTNLRIVLGTYYDDKMNLTLKGLSDIEFSFTQDWMPLLRLHVQDFAFRNYIEMENQDNFIDETHAIKLLILNRDNYKAGIRHVQEAINVIDHLVGLMPNRI